MTPAYTVLQIPLGRVVQDLDGTRWVFIGWRDTTTGKEAFFAREVVGRYRGPPWIYHASSVDALVRKFPELGDGPLTTRPGNASLPPSAVQCIGGGV